MNVWGIKPSNLRCSSLSFGVATLFFFPRGVGMGSEKSGLTSCQTKIRDDKSDETSKERSQVAN